MRSSILRFATAVALLLMTNFALQAQDATQNTSPPAPPASRPASPVPQRIRIGGNVQSAKIISKPLPLYPDAAKKAHIEGAVILHVIIAKDGSVQTVQYISGPQELTQAAMDGVRQWKYQPTLLNGEPVEVDTTVSVVFTLGDSAPSPAATTPAPAPAAASPIAIDPQLKADILHLLDVTHAVERAQSQGRTAFEPLRAQVTASMPATPNREKIVSAYFDKILALFQAPEFTDDLVSVYSRYFSDDDVKALTQFYQTPAGQHLNDHLGDIMADSMKDGQQLIASHFDVIFSELCKEYPELQGEAKFCPASSDRKSQLLPPAAQPTPDSSPAPKLD
jgi:TonB family protein